MRLVLDTNVFISGVFFAGPPFDILKSWRVGQVEIVVSAEILDEYRRVGVELSEKYTAVDLTPFLELLISHASVVHAPPLDERVCSDPDDDKFMACALAGRSKFICSGDKALLKISGYKGISVVTPRVFVDRYLPHKK
ncbi:MAG: putative toxin-antitoxin system toxin component, PIN family [Nitrospirota bacterium]|jgi:putative PIN family toxin of toxin-antitoxin system|nr:putative toxin-antitoxin system toxin component, PIN family [Nitrospirota bacterium]MDH5700183.1 putative toxin-antitoxin system toxin component, PIN family [Nitrospirota bacterium]